MEELSDSELEQMKKFEMLRRLGTAILLRRIWIPVVVFVAMFCSLFVVVGRRAQFAERFEAHAVLFFRPRATEHARAATQDEVVQILLRRTIREKLADRLAGGEASDGFRGTIARVTEFQVDERSHDVFYVIARASTAQAAVERVNLFASVCLEEYAQFRNADLDVVLKTAEETKRTLTERLEDLDKEEDALNRKMAFANPKQTLGRLNDAIQQRKTALSEANVRLAREMASQRKFESDLALLPKDLVDGIATVKALLQDIDKAGTEVSDAETRYTEKNPKLIVARERLATFKAKFKAFCEKHGIDSIDSVTIEKIETMLKGAADAKAQTELAQETTEALKTELAKDEAEARRLQEIVPNYDRLQRRRDAFHAALSDVEDTLADIRFQKTSIPQDLTLVEPVRVPDETPMMTPKKMILMFILSGGLAGGVLALIFIWEFLFGRVHDVRELTFFPEIVPLGALPPEKRNFASQQDEKRVLDGMLYRFHGGLASIRTLLVARLPGGVYSKRLHFSLDWNCAMCGKRVLRIEFVASREFEMTDDMVPLGGIVMGRNWAFFPVSDISRLEPSELTLLESDLKSLAPKYDLFVFGRKQAISDDSIFYEQMVKLCDAVALFVGTRKTPRRSLRRAVALQKKFGKPVYAVMTDEKSWRLVRGGLK